MFDNNMVSVIVPVYNAEKYIIKTIESLINQTYENLEYIFVDDCSTDHSEEIIKSYGDKIKNIVYYRQCVNQGVAVARNTALALAKGRYVAFLDSDDIWYPEKTECQINLMNKMNCPFSYTAIELIDEYGQLIKSKRNVKQSIDYKLLLRNTMIATSTVIVDRQILGEFKMPLRRGGQDYATWLMLLRDGVVAIGINEALVKYRISKHSLSSNKLNSIKQIWEIQTRDEGINYISVGYNLVCFSFNAFKKYFM